jgi:hypothetical protein
MCSLRCAMGPGRWFVPGGARSARPPRQLTPAFFRNHTPECYPRYPRSSISLGVPFYNVMPSNEKLPTVAENLRNLYAGRRFLWVEKEKVLATGLVVAVANTEVFLCDLTREGEKEPTTHNISILSTCWDEATKTGVIFFPLDD